MHPIAAWARERLRVPPGHRAAGRPLKLPPYLDRWLRRSAPRRVREAALSCARKNAKSTLVAVAGLYYLVGPGARPGWRGLVGGPDGVRSGETLDLAEALATANGLAVERRYHPAPPGRLQSKTGRLDFLSGSGLGGHASGADLAVLDECGLCSEAHRGLLAGLRTSTSARDGKLWLLGVRAQGPFLPEFQARADGGDPGVHCAIYAADAERDLTDRDGWREANPALGIVKPVARMRADARRACQSPEDEREFRALELNQEVDPVARELVIQAADFEHRCVTAEPPPRSGPVAVGLDVGMSAHLSAAALWWPATGRAECYGAVGGEPPLDRRGRADAVGDRYERMAARGRVVADWAGRAPARRVPEPTGGRGRLAPADLRRRPPSSPRSRGGAHGSEARRLARGLAFAGGVRRGPRRVPVARPCGRRAAPRIPAAGVRDPRFRSGGDTSGRPNPALAEARPTAADRRSGARGRNRGRSMAEAPAPPADLHRAGELMARFHPCMRTAALQRRWDVVRRRVLDRDRHRCRACGIAGAPRRRPPAADQGRRRPVGARQPAGALPRLPRGEDSAGERSTQRAATAAGAPGVAPVRERACRRRRGGGTRPKTVGSSRCASYFNEAAAPGSGARKGYHPVTNSQRLTIRLSECRQRLNELLGIAERTDEQTGELEALTGEVTKLEPELRAAIAAEGATDEAGGDVPDRETRERLELRGRSRVGAWIAAAVRGYRPRRSRSGVRRRVRRRPRRSAARPLRAAARDARP